VVAGALDDDRGLALADVVEDGLDLALGGRILGDVELELLAARLGGVVAGLVNGGARLGVGGSLLQDIGDADGRGRAGLVEEGDDVEAFRLPEGERDRALAAVVQCARVERRMRAAERWAVGPPDRCASGSQFLGGLTYEAKHDDGYVRWVLLRV
jgi:hypothetical protein